MAIEVDMKWVQGQRATCVAERPGLALPKKEKEQCRGSDGRAFLSLCPVVIACRPADR